MTPRKLLLVALGTQLALIALAWWSARVLHVAPAWGDPVRDIPIGVVAAVTLGAANHYLLTRAPANWLVNGVRAVYRDTILPLFGSLGPLSGALIGAAAGIGEEWLFRGIVQPLIGLLGASLLFGLAHVGSVRMVPFGLWASGMGMVMGSLALVTGGLLAPMTAHGVYDMLALEYIRRTSDRWHVATDPGADV